jgi:opacity protein-like surface antigen
MRRTYSIALGLALCAAAMPLSAQLPGMGLISSRKPLVQVGFGGGMSVPTSNAKEAFENGVHGRGFMLLNIPGLPSFRFDLSATKFDWKEAVIGSATMQGESQVLAGLANLSIDLFKGPIRPYVMAGVGAFHIRNELQAEGETDETSSQTRFGIDGGAGLAFKIKRLEMFVEGRVQNVYTERGVIDTKSIQTVPVTFGIIF